MNPDIVKRIDTFKDCVDLRAKYNELYEQDFDVVDFYSNNRGQIWVWAKSRYETYYGYEFYNYLTVIAYLENPFNKVNMNSTIEFNVSYQDSISYITADAHNTDGSVISVFDSGYIFGEIVETRFYICGCSSEEIRAGYCCVNCCNIAQEIKNYYENIIS